MAEEKLNNPTSDSREEQSAKGTELDEKGKEEELLAGKFKTKEVKKKSYEEVEKAYTKGQQELSTVKERLARLEGKLEAQKDLESKKAFQITPEERKKMETQFRDDFNKNALGALHNFNRPYLESISELKDELKKVKDDYSTLKDGEQQREMKALAKEARGESKEEQEEFDELKDSIEKELRGNKNWTRFENPYQAVFYHLRGKSTRKLAKAEEAERESFVERRSEVPPTKDKKKGYVQKIVKARTSTRL